MRFAFLKTAWSSLVYRKGAVIMSVLAVMMSVFVLLGVEHIRQEVRNNFTSTVSGVDLIVGPRTGQLNLLLYSVFHTGNATNNMSWQSAQSISRHRNVKWSIPLSIGDSHKGFRVVGTDLNFFEYFRYGKKRDLQFDTGRPFNSPTELVLGAHVAEKFGYQLEDRIVLAHGIASTSFTQHDNHPFTIVGILEATGTPVDHALYTSLEGIEVMHSGENHTEGSQHLPPKQITAMMIGLSSKLATFKVQRWINEYPREPLMAILPGVVLVELWQMMSVIEKALIIISSLTFVAALFGVTAMLLSSMRERRQELFVLRSLGASPWINYWMLTCEALLIVLIGISLAISLLLFALMFVNTYFAKELSMSFSLNIFHPQGMLCLAAIIVSVLVISLLPAIKAYKMTKA